MFIKILFLSFLFLNINSFCSSDYPLVCYNTPSKDFNDSCLDLYYYANENYFKKENIKISNYQLVLNQIFLNHESNKFTNNSNKFVEIDETKNSQRSTSLNSPISIIPRSAHSPRKSGVIMRSERHTKLGAPVDMRSKYENRFN